MANPFVESYARRRDLYEQREKATAWEQSQREQTFTANLAGRQQQKQFERYQEFVSPYLSQAMQLLGDPGGGGGTTPQDTVPAHAFFSSRMPYVPGGGGVPGASSGVAPGGYDPNDPALLAMTESIEQRGGEAQAAIASQMARLGIRGGPNLAAYALSQGETEAQVAQTKGEFAQSYAERQQRAWEAKLQMLMQLIGGLGKGFPS